MNKSAFLHILKYLLKNRDYQKYSDIEYSEIVSTATKQTKINYSNVESKVADVCKYYKKLNITENTSITKVLEMLNKFETVDIYCFMILIDNYNDYLNDEIILNEIKNFPKSIYRKNDLENGLTKARELLDYIVKSEKIDIEVLFDTDKFINEAKDRCLAHADLVFENVENSLKKIDEQISNYSISIENKINMINNDEFSNDDDNFNRVVNLMKQVNDINNAEIHVKDATFNDLIEEVSEEIGHKMNKGIKQEYEKMESEIDSKVKKNVNEITSKMNELKKSIESNFEHFEYKKIREYNENNVNHKVTKVLKYFETFSLSTVERVINLCLDHVDMIVDNHKKVLKGEKINYDDVENDIYKMKREVSYLKKDNKKILENQQRRKDFYKRVVKVATLGMINLKD